MPVKENGPRRFWAVPLGLLGLLAVLASAAAGAAPLKAGVAASLPLGGTPTPTPTPTTCAQSYTYTLSTNPADDGIATINVTGVDRAGNPGTGTGTILLDNTLPTAVIDAPTPNAPPRAG